MPFGTLVTHAMDKVMGQIPSWKHYSPGECLCRVSTGEAKDSLPLYSWRNRGTEKRKRTAMFPQGAGGKCQSPMVMVATVSPPLPTPPQRLKPQESLSQALTKCCSQFSPFLLGRILCLDGSRDTFPGPHICFHAGPEGQECKCLRGHNG